MSEIIMSLYIAVIVTLTGNICFAIGYYFGTKTERLRLTKIAEDLKKRFPKFNMDNPDSEG